MLIFSNTCRNCVGEAALARVCNSCIHLGAELRCGSRRRAPLPTLAELPWREFATRAKQPLEKKYELQTHAENLSGAGL